MGQQVSRPISTNTGLQPPRAEQQDMNPPIPSGSANQGSVDEVWPVMVLAYNEEEVIEASLDSIFDSQPGQRFEIFVMANGCTDRTEELVLNYAKKRPGVHLVSIALGDKCNAWNEFIHQTAAKLCPGHEVYFFATGDVRVVPGSLRALRRALSEDEYANAAAAPPASGRSGASDRRAQMAERALVANLYALRGSFVRRLQSTGARLPLNLEGDDGLIGALLHWDLAPDRQEMDPARITVPADAGWIFESLDFKRASDWAFYWRRAIRYARRHYEFKLLGPELKSKGLAGMPVDIRDLYPRSDTLPLRWQGPYTLTNWLALRWMRDIGRQRARG